MPALPVLSPSSRALVFFVSFPRARCAHPGLHAFAPQGLSIADGLIHLTI